MRFPETMISTAVHFCQSNPCILNRKNDRNSKKRKKIYAITTKTQSETWTIISKLVKKHL